MDRLEMLKRLSKGEHPIDVSIKKWKDVVRQIEIGVELQDINIDTRTCALCETTPSDRSDGCVGCLYLEYYGYDCTYGAYDRFIQAVDDYDREGAIQAAQDMVAELEAIKKGKENEN